MSDIRRTDHQIAGCDSMTLAVREVSMSPSAFARPIVLLHGARAGGAASFDLPVSGGSLASDLALAGHRVFVMDARGYGASSRPREMSQPASGQSPLVRSVDVVNDIEVVVNWISELTGSRQVAMLGWATGGHWAGYYASLHPDRVRQLVLYNTLYGGTFQHPSLGRGSNLEDPAHPGRFNREATGGWRTSDAASLLRTWDDSIPVDDVDSWRDPGVAAAYLETALAAEADGGRSASFTHPAGALEDSFYLATGRQLWDASFIRSHTLIIRSELDFWSRSEDVDLLQDHLIDAASVTEVSIANATHFAHLDRPGRGRDQFLSAVTAFLHDTA